LQPWPLLLPFYFLLASDFCTAAGTRSGLIPFCVENGDVVLYPLSLVAVCVRRHDHVQSLPVTLWQCSPCVGIVARIPTRKQRLRPQAICLISGGYLRAHVSERRLITSEATWLFRYFPYI
jgi:hypothetical protein